MTTLKYRRQGTTDTTIRPSIANKWYEQGEIVEVLVNNKVINIWVKE